MHSHLKAAEQQAQSVPQFCASHGISRAFFYILQRKGNGPRLMRVGRRTLVATEAAADWRRKMESDAERAAA